ncbi:Metal-dependent hydrolases of the beta-lactamase superfamily I [Chitinispirillum alkaliphilum]|nr:Metal-dependent hydrolases of the beta-lactamase superfamily I [Chitinispirillum alkaliphilum]
MFIRCLGARGGLPVSGCEFLKYGGDTTCIEITADSGDLVIVDAGSGIRSLNGSAANASTINLLFTHAHLDHILGFPFFTPLYNEEKIVNIFGYPTSIGPFKTVLENVMRDPLFPERFSSLSAKMSFIDIELKPFTIGSIKISPVHLNHPNGGVGYRFEESGKSFVFITDNELGFNHPCGEGFSSYVDFCRGADLLFHDAEFNEKEYERFKGWGHSLYSDTVKLAVESKVSRLGLFHINARRTDEEMDLFTNKAKELIHQLDPSICCFAVGAGFEIKL